VDEYELYEKWVSWGFSLESVLLAAGQMTRIDKPNFAYVNKILQRLNEKGIADHEQVAAELNAPRPSAGNEKFGWSQNGAPQRSGGKAGPAAGESFMKREYEKFAPETRVLREDDPDEA
jgi:hypothetical protein